MGQALLLAGFLVGALIWIAGRWLKAAWALAAFRVPATTGAGGLDSNSGALNCSEIQAATDQLQVQAGKAEVQACLAEPELAMSRGDTRPPGLESLWVDLEAAVQPRTNLVHEPGAGDCAAEPNDRAGQSSGAYWTFAEESVLPEGSPIDAVDGLPIPAGELPVFCGCGLVYRRPSVLWLLTHLEGRCAGCGDTLLREGLLNTV
jgi:hypothetical protein